MKKIKNITILGSGTSTGIPMLGCHCNICKSDDILDKRLRTSILIETNENKYILVDTTPDFRHQALANQIDQIDSVIITHDHADHSHGIDDLRPLSINKNIDIFTNTETFDSLKVKFPYIFKREQVFNKDRPVLGGGIPLLDLFTVEKSLQRATQISGLDFYFFELPHGYCKSLCFYTEGLAYIIDCSAISEDVILFLKSKGVELLIIDCLQHENHQTHLNIDKAFKYIKEIKAKRSGLIHMNHHVSHQELKTLADKSFGSDVFPTFDNQQLQL